MWLGIEFIMKIEISINGISHEKYNQVIDYLRDEKQKIRQKNAGKTLEKIYHFYVKGNGNPPKYDLTINLRRPLEEFPEDAKKIKESFKGLIELLDF